ncbi:hypothetical protein [Streptomyces sp. MMG1533]|uniref:hypothetical protein n=1 Tax=Streptomyces sp. MMG1533 TaxID=1415546 RepID=UPI00131BD84D|nr:hypothetical protein [Streptomyces sp. MMG1533]
MGGEADLGLTQRIKRRIAKDYAGEDREAVEEIIVELAKELKGGGGDERITAATLIRSQGEGGQDSDCSADRP